MRIGIFGDVLGNLAALQAVLADGQQQQIERWVCLGDVAFKGPQSLDRRYKSCGGSNQKQF